MKDYKSYTLNRSIDDAKRLYENRIEDALNIFQKYSANFIERDCFCCGSSEYVEDVSFKETYGVCKCLDCGSTFVNPVPNEQALQEYYNNCSCNALADSLYVKRNSNKDSSFVVDGKVLYVDKFLRELVEHKRQIRILEVGCGSGGFLKSLKDYVESRYSEVEFLLMGIDIDGNAIKNKVSGDLELFATSVENFLSDQRDNYDLILSFELLEHLTNPILLLKKLENLLNDHGAIIFSTPNSDGLLMRRYDYNSSYPFAHSIFPPMHLNAFSLSNIKLFAFCSGFVVFDVETPGKLDLSKIEILDTLSEDAFLSQYDFRKEDRVKDMVQYLLINSLASTYMLCTLKKKSCR